MSGNVSTEFEVSSPAWGNRSPGESRWPATLALGVAVLFYVILPETLIYVPFGVSPAVARWIVPALEIVLIVPLQLTMPEGHTKQSPLRRMTALALIGLVNLANIGSLIQLVNRLLHGTLHSGGALGPELLYSAILIWLTNVIIFALWYWELDRGGPGARCAPVRREPDFLFPQMINPKTAPKGWTPNFLDYLYVSFTNATAFSPTDTMPMTETAKALMLVQSSASVLIVVLVAARAVNILG